ncbi:MULTISPECIES: hypothetical protein [Haloferax]|uniref:Uncharacterized protein n=1 Tax=Haloferax marinum TaxID=2666143 RepID=A0A6A8G245_9EURY|nr:MULTISPECIES: hypothetical protein [Haloferax]KAB1196173.1 hypothetical protein Hfx1150_01065 [Haloferax sp. CBA1150]MRW95160.1 hypothetical protein [Haloferax marinum]
MTDNPDAEDAGATEDVDGGDDPVDAEEVTNAEAEHAADGGMHEQNGNGDETVPHVELSLYELSVRVSGQSDDKLEDVEQSATRLMEFLIDQTKQLEDQPDTRGLS